ncbi:MAG: UbiD family decarboxylase [Rhodospirillaceae bacterium]|nr:UbiD family decarboxylase [Rhodospirillaceae bacterium]MBT3886477.1 UbiD family decarboxylase [Rhodospirillaceae bacterium]MBT4117940.1 UbiD family decarboxylase [Rhodospirillaceae bacterium]MBT4671586.1 UbiD family decarboxylase [Rhodospirillaceae bacterium]MBT4719818.1 UbiD family decarboxylase [Rhodospirillaceae bacterium]
MLRRVHKTVDRSWEPASMIKWAFQALSNEDRFGLLFENVDGSSLPLCTGLLGASRQAYALALGIEPDDINRCWENALLNPIKPISVDTAPCQEIVQTGEDVRLGELPVPTWTPGKDLGPYLTTTVMTMEHGTGNQNTGVYRTYVRDENHVVVNLRPNRHGHDQCATWWAEGKAAPIAWVIGAEPAFQLASVAALPAGAQEMEIAGGLKGAPVELVKCLGSDIMVPANAEIIIEGEIQPGELDAEGPFGENIGFMMAEGQKAVALVTAVTKRKDAIYYGITSQMPPSESTVLQSTANAALVFKRLRHDLGETAIHDLYVDLTFGGQMAHAIVSMTPAHPGHGMKIGRMMAEISSFKRITVVDEDIDIRDPVHMDWVLNTRYNPAVDTVIVENVFMRGALDPSVPRIDGVKMGSKLVIDATRRYDEADFSMPPRETMMKALDSWNEEGLPEFTVPKRAQLRIDKS